jgi:uncharacterized membrane protein
MIYALALAIGVIAGLRAMIAPAAVSWAAWYGWLPLEGTPLALLGHPWAVGLFTLLAALELFNDKRSATPSRKAPIQFAGRIVMGGLAGAAIGLHDQMLVPGLVAGMVGAVLGTYAGASLRAALAGAFGRDLPAALIEDVIAIGGAVLVVCHL